MAVGPFRVEGQFFGIGEGSVDQFFGIAFVLGLFVLFVFSGLRNELFAGDGLLFLESCECGERLVKSAVVGGLVAEIEGEASHIVLNESFVLQADGAFGEPVELRHISDKKLFGRVCRRVRLMERCLEGFEFGGIFMRKENCAGCEAVA